MPFHKPPLDIMLFPREQKAQPAELLKLEHGQAMCLSNIDDAFREYHRRDDFGQSVEQVCYNPIEHFNEKREFL